MSSPLFDQKELADKLINEHKLSLREYAFLIENRTQESSETLREAAVKVRRQIYGDEVYLRGLIEISSYCKNDCLYCGIRKSNRAAERYRRGTVPF